MNRRTKARLLAVVLTASVSALAACSSGSGGGSGVGEDGGAPGDDAAVEPGTVVWVPDAHPTDGMAAWLEAERGEDDALQLVVRTRGLGELFGLSAHVVWAPDVATLAQDPDSHQAPPVLDPDGDGAAVTLFAARDGDVALGGTRASPTAGPVVLDDEVVLARLGLRLSAEPPLPARLELTRAVVARADGRLQALPSSGGTLALEEVAP